MAQWLQILPTRHQQVAPFAIREAHMTTITENKQEVHNLHNLLTYVINRTSSSTYCISPTKHALKFIKFATQVQNSKTFLKHEE